MRRIDPVRTNYPISRGTLRPDSPVEVNLDAGDTLQVQFECFDPVYSTAQSDADAIISLHTYSPRADPLLVLVNNNAPLSKLMDESLDSSLEAWKEGDRNAHSVR